LHCHEILCHMLVCVKTGIHKLTQCELSRCSRRFFAERKQDKLRSTVLGWTLFPRGVWFAAMMNTWSVSRKSIPFAIETSVTVTSFIISNEISTIVLSWTLKFQSWNQRFVKYFSMQTHPGKIVWLSTWWLRDHCYSGFSCLLHLVATLAFLCSVPSYMPLFGEKD